MAMHLLRILAAIAAVASGVWVGYADWSARIPFDAIISLMVTFGGYMTFEWSDRDVNDRIAGANATVPSLSQHDVDLGQRLVNAFPPAVQYLLRDHSFGQVFHRDSVDPLHDLSATWKGVDHEFVDAALETKAVAVIAANEAFLEKMTVSVGVADNYPPTSYSVPTQRERANDIFEDRTHEVIRELDGLATALLAAYDDFKREYRGKTTGTVRP